ncbi:MAG: phospholipase [Rhizobacter sp.]|nr:phospholipase [Rhizobacter sp.]
MRGTSQTLRFCHTPWFEGGGDRENGAMPNSSALPFSCFPSWRLLTGVGGVLVSQLAFSATTVELGACAAMPDPAQRLGCYDALAKEALPAAQLLPQPVPAHPDPASPLAERPKSTGEGTLLERQWDLLPDQQRGALSLSPYKPIYVLARATNHINNSPSSPTLGPGYPSDVDLNRVEAKIQLSFKAKLWERPFGTDGNVWFGYTQNSFWQLGNHRDSSPFRDTVYEPELIATYPLNLSVGGLKLRMASLSLTHQSNGQPKPLSRSWNRAIAGLGLETGAWTINLRGWTRVMEDKQNDDNPNILDNIGRAEITATRSFGPYVATVMARHSLRGGDNARGAVQFDLAFPLAGPLMGHLQAFNGFGESLIDYNYRQTSVGIGISYNDPR